MPSSDWVVLLQITLFCLELHPAASLRCMYSNPNDGRIRRGEKQPNITVTKDGKVAQCLETDYCFVFWFGIAPNETIVSQGCWNQPGTKCNDAECISADPPPRAKNDSMFCCCSTDLCNWNYSNGYMPSPTVEFKEQEPSKLNTLTIALIFTFVLVLVAVILIVLRSWYLRRKLNSDSLNLIECPLSFSQPFVIDNLKIDEVTIGRGRYGYVCRGTLNGSSVAVKIFNQQNKQYFANERDIYTLPHFEHPCIVEFLGAGERMGEDGRTEYLIVLSHAPQGCLNDFLSNQTIDWSRLCKMAYSLACGLTHLHTEIIKEDHVKPCIAHRDLSSRNVLIGEDGGCMICDFGFAIKIKGGSYYHNGELKVAETTSLADVGTLRYMAPEVLEGAVNLRDCESSLKQADVYSFGLVLWEIATRCTDLYQGMEVPPYQLAYEKEVGQHPSMEKMQVLVTINKARPLFPDIWKDNNPAIRALKDTIVECWDPDAEARLTSLCAETRLKDLLTTWERYKGCINSSGVIPKVNFTTTVHHHPSSSAITDVPAKCSSVDACQDLMTISEGEAQKAENKSISESTSETSLTESPCESICTAPIENQKNNATDNVFSNSSVVPRLSVPLQPHQGRNPSIERNLMKEPVQDMICKGNTLFQKEHENSTYPSRFSNQDVYNVPHHDSNALVPSDTVSPSNRAYHPIPYVRNAAHVYSTIPKLHNTPDNGGLKSHSLFGLINQRLDKRCEPTGKNSLKFFDRGRTSKDEALDEERVPLSASRSNGVVVNSNTGAIGCNVSDYKNLIANNQLLQHHPLNYNATDCVVLPAPNGHMKPPVELRSDMCIDNSALVPHTNGIDNAARGKGVKRLLTERIKKSLSLNSNGVRQAHSNGKAKNVKEEAYLNGKLLKKDGKVKEPDSIRYCNGSPRFFSSHASGFDTLPTS